MTGSKRNASSELFKVLNEKFKPQHFETILLLQYFKLVREEKHRAEEWMGYLKIKVKECTYEERDRRLKEQFINGVNDNDMMTEIIRYLNIIKNLMK